MTIKRLMFLGLALGIFVSAGYAFAATSQVTPSNNNGWTPYTEAGGQVTFTSDSTAPSGSGAAELSTPATSDVAGLDFTTTPTAITSNPAMGYSTIRLAGDAHASPSYVLGIDTNSDNAEDIYAWYEPVYNGGSNYDQWQSHTIDASTTQFWSFDPIATSTTMGGANGSNFFTLNDVEAAYPGSKIVELSINQGTGNDGWQTRVDNVIFDGTTFDLDPDAATSTPSACNGSTFDGFALGSVDGQGGWSATGPYDQEVASNVYGFDSFGCKTLRVSNAVTSGSFGDWIFTPAISNPAGEMGTTTASSTGATTNHYEAQFDIASTMSTPQPGLQVSVSPVLHGQGNRMSYLRFVDQADGIHVFFDDYTSGTFNESDIATLDRTAPHTVKFVLDFADGAGNDTAKIYIDGNLEKTGATWEDYYRDNEPTASTTVDSLLIQARDNQGGNVPANDGNGFIFDNFDQTSSAPATTTPPTTGNNGGGSGGGSRGGGSTTFCTATITTFCQPVEGQGTTQAVTPTPVATGLVLPGQVLGAATFFFTQDLTVGSTGPEVVALQQMLVAEGYLVMPIGTPYGYFGGLTRAAVARWQAANGVAPAVGYWGPISRARANASGGVPIGGTTVNQAQIASLKAQVITLIQEMIQILEAEIAAKQ